MSRFGSRSVLIAPSEPCEDQNPSDQEPGRRFESFDRCIHLEGQRLNQAIDPRAVDLEWLNATGRGITTAWVFRPGGQGVQTAKKLSLPG